LTVRPTFTSARATLCSVVSSRSRSLGGCILMTCSGVLHPTC
jgi:hypothetical protein